MPFKLIQQDALPENEPTSETIETPSEGFAEKHGFTPNKKLKPLGDKVKKLAKTGAVGAGSTLAGALSMPFQLINDFVAKPMNFILGNESVPYEETMIGKAIPPAHVHKKTLEENFPTSKPETKFEQFFQNVIEDGTSLYTGSRLMGGRRYGLGPARSFAISTAANTLGKGAEELGVPKDKADYIKNGSMFLMSLVNPNSARTVMQQNRQRANFLLPQHATVSATRFQNRLNTLRGRIMAGRPMQNLSPSERFVIDHIDNFERLIQNGRINVSQLERQKVSFNEARQQHIFATPDRHARANARRLSSDISHGVRDTFAEYGQVNPEWYQAQRNSDIAHGAMEGSNFIKNTLERFLIGRSEWLHHAFGIGLPIASKSISGLAPIALPLGYQTAKILYRMARSPLLRNHYTRVLSAAAGGNEAKIKKELDELEKAKEKESKKKKKFKLIHS